MQKNQLSAHNLVKVFMQDQKPITIIDKVSYTFIQGHTYAITGMSGMGKSTLLHLIAGIDAPNAGTVTFNDQDIQTLSSQERALFFNQSLGLAFQQPYLIRELTVLENIMIPGIIQGKTQAECQERGHIILKLTGLAAKAHNLPGTLSGGQQQRVALARAVFNQPVFLLADEPTGSLDETTSKAIVDLLLTYQQEWGMGIIVATHDMILANRMQTIIHVHDGQINSAHTD